MEAGVFAAEQADNTSAITIAMINTIFFILTYDFPLVLLSFVIRPSCNVTTRWA